MDISMSLRAVSNQLHSVDGIAPLQFSGDFLEPAVLFFVIAIVARSSAPAGSPASR